MEEEKTLIPVQVTSKDPKKVEAGRKLAEYNRKKKEELMQKAQTIESRDETTQDNKSNNYIMYGVLGLTIAAVGIGYFVYNKKKDHVVHTRQLPNRFQME